LSPSVVDVNNVSAVLEAQLYNTTDAIVVGVVQIFQPSSITQRQGVGGFAEVVFSGASKTVVTGQKVNR